MNFSAQFDSLIHGLSWVDAVGSVTTTNRPQWTITEARDEEGQAVALNGQDLSRAKYALDVAWSESLGYAEPEALGDVDLSFDELPEEHYFEVLS